MSDLKILNLLADNQIVLTPAIIAYNTDIARSTVTKRLDKLTEESLIHKVERGKYIITEDGINYSNAVEEMGSIRPPRLDEL